MTGGRRGAAVLALALSGCLGSSGTLEIRPTATSLAETPLPVPERIAEARGQVALGNVALGLELFRKAAREDPASTEALAGMADCYGRMNRFDLSRRYLEQALALAPADAGLLTALASTLDRQDKGDEALAVRQELAARAIPTAAATTVSLPAPSAPEMAAATEPTAEPEKVPTAPVPAPAQAITVALPAAAVPRADAEPRLERMSLGEVALVTTGRPRWQPDLAAETRRRSAGPTTSETRLAAVRLLNAARQRGLAARTRSLLLKQGWNRIAIGDSARVRGQSLILYSDGNRAAARRLSAQMGIALAASARPGGITVLLGADAAAARKRRRS